MVEFFAFGDQTDTIFTRLTPKVNQSLFTAGEVRDVDSRTSLAWWVFKVFYVVAIFRMLRFVSYVAFLLKHKVVSNYPGYLHRLIS